jgi:uncharacterized phosphosugar-binding protein
MEYITLEAAKKAAQTDFIALLESVKEHSPVIIGDREHKRDGAVVMMMSSADFEEYRKMRGKAFMEFCDTVADNAAKRGLTPEIAQTLLEP